jgi:uncharacterized protein (DUF1684 family)
MSRSQLLETLMSGSRLRLTLVLAIALSSPLMAATRPVTLTPAAASAALKDIEKDRTDTQAWLKSDPTSYLATVDRQDFGNKSTLTVGRARDNDVRIDDADVLPHHLRVTVEGDRFRVERVDAHATFKVAGKDKTFVDVPSGTATVVPGSLKVGRFLLRLSHQRFPAIIVFDPKSPRYPLYKGLKYFPPDLSYRYELPLTPNPKPETTMILSTRGNQRRATRVGWFDFMVGDKPARLEAVRLLEPGVGENDLGIFFRDATTGKESYELGRYVDVKKLPSGLYLLDFNFAYNPACAYSDHYNCPIPPKNNVLRMAIRAGEMDSHYH